MCVQGPAAAEDVAHVRLTAVRSKSEINRCGERLRDWWADSDWGLEDLSDELEAVWEFRGGFSYPTQKVAVGLRQFVQRESATVVVAQRIKRLPQIVHKLVRFPETRLARMEDVGGCRAVLAGGRAEVEGVLARIERNWDVKRLRNYTSEPKSSGYRGVHVVVERDGHRVEVQLRTVGQQEWGEQVERLAGRHRLPLKDEEGPDELLDWLRLAAEGIARSEAGLPLDIQFEARFSAARKRAQRWLQPGERR